MWCASILKHDLHHLQNSPAAANIFTFTNWLLRNLHFIWIFKQYFHLQRRSVFLLVQDARSICIFYQCQRPQAFIADCRIVPAHHQAVCPRAKFSVTIAPFLLDTVPVRSNYPVPFLCLPKRERISKKVPSSNRQRQFCPSITTNVKEVAPQTRIFAQINVKGWSVGLEILCAES